MNISYAIDHKKKEIKFHDPISYNQLTELLAPLNVIHPNIYEYFIVAEFARDLETIAEREKKVNNPEKPIMPDLDPTGNNVG